VLRTACVGITNSLTFYRLDSLLVRQRRGPNAAEHRSLNTILAALTKNKTRMIAAIAAVQPL
jgi:hypothetical protein